MILHRLKYLNHLLHFISFLNLSLLNISILQSDPFTGTNSSDLVCRFCRSGIRSPGTDCRRTCLVGQSTDVHRSWVSYLGGHCKVNHYHYYQRPAKQFRAKIQQWRIQNSPAKLLMYILPVFQKSVTDKQSQINTSHHVVYC